jgi:hypothetical protein
VVASAEARAQQFKRSIAETDTAASASAARGSADALARQSNPTGADTSNGAPAAMASASSVAPVAPRVQGSANAEPRDEASDARTDLSAADKAVLMAKEAGVASPQDTPAPEAERRAARAVAKVAVVPPHPADPKVWLQQIDALRAAGKADQADGEMRRFKAAFPNYGISPAPPDLPK